MICQLLIIHLLGGGGGICQLLIISLWGGGGGEFVTY